jgi:hypothetical protein
MSAHELATLLSGVEDTGDLVLRRARSEALEDAWRDALAESSQAWVHWRNTRSRDAFTAYRAAQDREDAAQDALAARSARAPGARMPYRVFQAALGTP